jgi:hypothetical protein
MSMKRTVAVQIIVALAMLGCAEGYAQNTPALSQARGNTGISGNEAGSASNFEFFMDPAGYPRAVTAGETIVMMGSWPTGNNPTMTDDASGGSNTWGAVTSCNDGTMSHGFFYVVNAKAGTATITETHGSAISNGVFDWAHFYGMSTTVTGFVGGSSCSTGQTPANNTAPNITGTAYAAAAGDLLLNCVYVEGGLGQIQGNANAITSITWPTGFTGLTDDVFYGHACAYAVATSGMLSGGMFTPTFTIAQAAGQHSSFTIMSVDLKAGSGGTAPSQGASVLLAEMHYTSTQSGTDHVYLPCPSGTTDIVALDDVQNLVSITDSNGNSYTAVNPPAGQGHILYSHAPNVSGTLLLNLKNGTDGGYDLYGLYCLGNTDGIDTTVTAKNSSTLDGAGSGVVYNNGTASSSPLTDAPSVGTTVPGDLILAVGPIGVGPATSCVAGHCVFDYVGSTNWSNGDNESYENGDIMAHYYAGTAGTANFQFNVVTTGTGWSDMAIAFQPSSGVSQDPPAAPTGLTATVQ